MNKEQREWGWTAILSVSVMLALWTTFFIISIFVHKSKEVFPTILDVIGCSVLVIIACSIGMYRSRTHFFS